MKRPNHGTVVAYLALFIALGGTTFAATHLGKSSVGTRQLKREAVTAAKVKKGTLTGAQISAATLGIVPAAQTAQSAQSARTADTAAVAKSAESAGTAKNAATADLARSVSPPEPWHEVTSFETCSIGPTVPWEAAGGALATPAYYRDPLGVVHLRGSLRCPASHAWDYSIFTLPPGYRPEAFMYFPAVAGYNQHGAVGVGANGEVDNRLYSEAAAEQLSLDAVSFRCGPSGQNGCP